MRECSFHGIVHWSGECGKNGCIDAVECCEEGCKVECKGCLLHRGESTEVLMPEFLSMNNGVPGCVRNCVQKGFWNEE